MAERITLVLLNELLSAAAGDSSNPESDDSGDQLHNRILILLVTYAIYCPKLYLALYLRNMLISQQNLCPFLCHRDCFYASRITHDSPLFASCHHILLINLFLHI
jgi:hypothetical protein